MYYNGSPDSMYVDTAEMFSIQFHTSEKNGLLDLVGNHSGYLMDLPQQEIFFFFFMALFIGFALASVFLGDIITGTFYAAIRFNTAVKIINDNSQLQKQIDFILIGLYFLAFGLFLFILQNKTGWIPYNFHGLKLYGFNLFLLLSIFISRYLVLKMLGIIFEQGKLFSEYLNHGYLYNKLVGIILLPLTFFMVFTVDFTTQIVFYITVAALVFILSMKLFRRIIFSLKHGILNFYLFLYLCALEIVPLLLLYKWYFFIACSA